MISVPEMIMIGGNSRNSGKTAMACNCITKLSATHEVIGLKVTSVRPGEEDMHGNHSENLTDNFTIFEEKSPESQKDTSKMLKAGASHVYYIRAEEIFIQQAVLHFLSKYINKQIIVCESRSLRGIITPGLFLMMMRLPEVDKVKNITDYLSRADEVFYFGEDLGVIKKFTENLNFMKGNFFLEQLRATRCFSIKHCFSQY